MEVAALRRGNSKGTASVGAATLAIRGIVPYSFVSANCACRVTVSLPSVTKRRYVPLRLT